ncbi:SDR family oxidoreductase [Microbacterium sp.]|uniref:SDR family NAD(P)-dependent oxidoreductase n=1 Tax=Microbacterium sp. TaxID=51671 RepID=UPI002899F954|nr:SDR family oxidoreductase [Microbacterium sp.]
MGTLDDKVAIITGSGSGVGRGIALALAKEGAAIGVIDINDAGADETVALIEAAGGRALTVHCDIRRSAEVDAAVSSVVEAFGNVDILVNNAQGARGQVPFEEITDEDLDLVFQAGPIGAVYFMRAAFPYLKDGYGRVINVRSGAEQIPLPGMGAYIAAKGAIGGVTRIAAREWGQYGITVNSIAPAAMTDAAKGYFDANPDKLEAVMAGMSLKRFGDAEADAGRAVAFLAGPDASYITGTTVSVDGGGAFYS